MASLVSREYHGRSILRPAYKHYYCIDIITRYANIGIGHSMAGVPVGRAPANYKTEDLAKFKSILQALRRHEASGLVLPAGWDLVDGRQLGGSDSVGFLDYLQWHEAQFLRVALCDFAVLGTTETGTQALATAKIDFSQLCWDALAQHIARIITRHGFTRVAQLNGYEDTKAAPKLEARPIASILDGGGRQAGAFVGDLAAGRESAPPAETKAELAEWVGEGLGVRRLDGRAEGAPWQPHPPAPSPQAERLAEGAPWRPHPPAPSPQAERGGKETPRMFSEADVQAAVARVGQDQAAAMDGWQSATRGVMQELLRGLLEQLAAGQSLGPAAIAAVKADPEVADRLRDQVATWLIEVNRTAREQMAQQLGREVAPPELLESTLRAQALVIAEDLVALAEREVRLAALRGETTDQIAARFEEALGARLRGQLAEAGQSAAADAVTPTS